MYEIKTTNETIEYFLYLDACIVQPIIKFVKTMPSARLRSLPRCFWNSEKPQLVETLERSKPTKSTFTYGTTFPLLKTFMRSIKRLEIPGKNRIESDESYLCMIRVEKKSRWIKKKKKRSSEQNGIEEKTIKKPKKREKKGRSRCGVGQGSPEQTETVIYLKRETNMAETFSLSSKWQKLSISETTLEKREQKMKKHEQKR